MFKICVIGCGAMSTSGHGPSFVKYKENYSDVSLSGCCDLDIRKAEEYKNKFGFEKAYSDYKIMLDEIKPDVVSLISPVNLTCELAIDIIKKGYNIILEKPPGRNREEIERMIKQARESGVCVRTSFNRRYTPLILELKKSLKENNDKIYNIVYQMYRYNRQDNDFSTTAIHAIDVVKNIAGSDYKHIDFRYQFLPEIGENVKNIYMNCLFKNGINAYIAIVPVGGTTLERISVNSQGNTYLCDLPFWKNIDSPGKYTHISEQSNIKNVDGDGLIDSDEMYEESGFYEENRSFFEYLRNGGATYCDLESAIQSVEIADCIRKCAGEYSD